MGKSKIEGWHIVLAVIIIFLLYQMTQVQTVFQYGDGGYSKCQNDLNNFKTAYPDKVYSEHCIMPDNTFVVCVEDCGEFVSTNIIGKWAFFYDDSMTSEMVCVLNCAEGYPECTDPDDCVPGDCVDTDGGKDYRVKGTATAPTPEGETSWEDQCTTFQNYDLVEGYCFGGDVKTEMVDCSAEFGSGSYCSDGACIGGSQECNTVADTNCDGCVHDNEFPTAVSQWLAQTSTPYFVSDDEFPVIVNKWLSQVGC